MIPGRDYKKEAEAEAAIAKDVARFGVTITSPWDFVGTYPKASLTDPRVMEVLARHLNVDHPYVVSEGVMFALGQPAARPFAFKKLLHLILTHPDNRVRQSAAHPFNKMLLPEDANILGELILNSSLEHASGLFVEPYVRLKRRAAIPLLRMALPSSFNGPKLQAAEALSKLGDQDSRANFVAMTQSADTNVKKAGRDAIKRLDKKLKKLRWHS